MSTPRSTLRNTPGWIGATLAAVAVVAGAAVGAQASSSSPSSSSSSGSALSPAGSVLAAGSSSAKDPHEAAAQRQVAQMLAAFRPPPGAAKSADQPDPLPSGLRHPPMQSATQTQVTAVAWYSAPQSPDQVLAWVKAHLPAGSSLSAWGDSQGLNFVSLAFPGQQSWLIVTPQSGSDGRTVVRLDASVVWTPSRQADTLLGYGAPSVSVVTESVSSQSPLPAAETRTLTSASPTVVHHVVDLLNALRPAVPGFRSCPMDDGTRVLITLSGQVTATAAPGGCGGVTITPQGGPPQRYDGGPDLITQVYALFGITWSRTGGLPPGTERTAASGTR